ncbi:MAG TPA: hypothetical protein VEL76_23930 [Gemmataceae bacterium]|nr:hypothetical protein [Gemmataceae bacterium]
MTPDDWRTCPDLDAMLTFARRRANFSQRKRRLFACGCCQRLGPLLPEAHRRALAVAEQFADGLVSQAALTTAWSRASFDDVTRSNHAAWAAWAVAGDPRDALLTQTLLSNISLYAANAIANRPLRACSVDPRSAPTWHVERTRHRSLLRDVIHPFRTGPLDATHLPATVTAIAGTIYEERRFEELPILADALEEAGCENPDLLAHCRAAGEHVRGCWAVDWLLGKQ